MFLGIDVDGRDALHGLDAGVEVPGVGELNDAHIEDYLAVAVKQPADGGVEGGESGCRRVQGDGSRGRIDDRALRSEDVAGEVADIVHLFRAEAGEIEGFQRLRHEPDAVFAGVAGHHDAVRIEGNVERVRNQRESPHGLSKCGVIDIQAD